MILTPEGNSSHPCFGVEVYAASHPPVPPAYFYVSLVIFVLFELLAALTIIPIWKFRNNPRFAKIRPVSLSCLLICGLFFYNFVVIGKDLVPLPCAFQATILMLSVSIFAISLSTRALVISIEAQYARLARSMNALSKQDHHMEDSTVISDESLSRFHGVLVLVKVAFGFNSVSHLSFADVRAGQQSFRQFVLLSFVPGVFTIAVLLGSASRLLCGQCIELFLEIPIAMVVYLSLAIGVVSRCFYVAFSLVGWDDKGVLYELLGVVMFAGVPIVVVWILILFDPNDWNFNYVLSWMWCGLFGGLSMWWMFFGKQFYVAYNWHVKSTTQLVPSNMSGTMKEMFRADPVLREEFHTFAEKQFIMESLMFLEDVEVFRHLFYDKAESWQRSKAKLLLNTYIDPVSSKLTINIGFEVRDKLMNAPVSIDMFNEAEAEITKMVELGAWKEFWSRRQGS